VVDGSRMIRYDGFWKRAGRDWESQDVKENSVIHCWKMFLNGLNGALGTCIDMY
jgi:hypothetical protein